MQQSISGWISVHFNEVNQGTSHSMLWAICSLFYTNESQTRSGSTDFHWAETPSVCDRDHISAAGFRAVNINEEFDAQTKGKVESGAENWLTIMKGRKQVYKYIHT